MRKLLLCIVMMCISIGYGQELPKVIPMSPEAASIGKFGQVPVGLFTGTIQASIPVYQFSSGGLQVPVSVNYSSNGIRVDEYGSSVGLGWNLSAGGVITRSVNGKRDENQYIPAKNVNLDAGADQYNFVVKASNYSPNGVDTQPDIFSFNFNGYSGKFYLDDNSTEYRFRNIVFLEPSPLKIEIVQEGSLKKFKVTDPMGVVYFFGGVNAEEKFRYLSTNQTSNNEDPQPATVSAWYLTKMIHPISGEELTFSYITGEGGYKNSVSQSIKRQNKNTHTPTSCAANGDDSAYLNFALGNFCHLTEISSTRSGKLSFSYSQKANMPPYFKKLDKIEIKDKDDALIKAFDFNYIMVTSSAHLANNDFTQESYYNKRYYLSSVKEQSAEGNYLNPYVLSYDNPQDLPPRFSFAQDYWGFYNGKNNTNLIDQKTIDKLSGNYLLKNALHHFNGADRSPDPAYAKKGLLSKIEYPTKGSNTFTYEGHSYYGNVTTEATTTTEMVEVNATTTQRSFEVHNITYNHKGTLSFGANIDDFFQSNGLGGLGGGTPLNFNIAAIRVYDITNGQSPALQPIYALSDIHLQTPITTPYGFNNTNFTEEMVVNLIKDHDYRFEISLYPDSSFSSLQLNYKSTAPTTTQQQTPVGGMRIAKVDMLDNTGSIVTKNYHYGRLDCLDCDSASVISKNIEQSVSESETLYCIARPGGGIVCTGSCGFTTISSNTMFSIYGTQGYHIGYNSVIEEIGTNFKGGAIVHEFEGNFLIEPSTAVLGEYMSGLPYTNFFGFGREVKKTWYSKSNSGLIKVQETSRSYAHKPNLDKTTKVYVARQKTVPDPGYQHITSYVYLNRWFEINQYNIKRQWHVLDQETSTLFDTNGLNPITTITNYKYENPLHLQVTSTEVINSKGEKYITDTKYAHDLNNTTLINAHRIVEPISTEVSKKVGSLNTSLNGQNTVYATKNGLYVPAKIQVSKGAQALEDRIIYHQYDDKGNPVEVSKKDGTKIYYVWGYNSTQPIAKIEGYTTISSSQLSVINTAILSSNIDTSSTAETTLRSRLASIRAAFPEAQVTSFTYDPLIGVTSITDPRGETMYYQYDGFNRLRFIKNAQGQILKEHAYNHKN